MNTGTTQQEVVECPRWVQVADATLAQHRYLSQEKREGVAEGASAIGVHALRDVSLEHANWDKVDWESKKRFSPMGEEKWEFLRSKDETAGSTCRWCPDPHTDGYREFFPTRCKDCATLNSYRARGRNTAKKLVSIKKALELENVLWTMTFPLVYSNKPLEQDEIVAIAKERRVFISQNLFRDKKIWHDQFVGINVMECVVTEPGKKREARFPNDPYSREASNMWSYHIHGHYLVLNHKKSKVNLKLAYEKFGCPNKETSDTNEKHKNQKNEMPNQSEMDDSLRIQNNDDTDDQEEAYTPIMRLTYKHERDYDRRYLNSRGETIGERDEMKIMRDYLVGYARKDCIGKYAWNGDKNWRKVRSVDSQGNYFDEDGNELWYED